jgi:hypothetical protein
VSGLCKNDKKEKGMGKKNRKVKHTIKRKNNELIKFEQKGSV